MSDMIKAVNLSKSYRQGKSKIWAVRDADFTISRKEAVLITGPSGAGKSTLLHLLGGLDAPSGGKLFFDGVDFYSLSDKERSKARNEKIGFIFQSFNLIPDLNLFANVDVPLRYRGFNTAERKRRIENVLETVGLASRMKHLPSQLSGGQQQRVAIARALALEPSVMLFDEPTSSLDPRLTQEVLRTIRALTDNGMTMLMATHEMRFAEEIATEIAYMDAGRIVERGKPEQIFHSPAEESTKDFMSCIL